MLESPEPWLRGPLPDTHPLVAPSIFALMQAGEDLRRHTIDITDAELWTKPLGLAPLGFQLRHIAGSIDRLLTYFEDRQLTEAQLAALRSEMEPHGTCVELIAAVQEAIARASAIFRSANPATLTEERGVGRKRLPTTVIGLAVHIAEHTQRHLGEAIVLCRVLRALR